MQEPSYLSKIALVSIWFRIELTQIITQVYKESLTLTYPPYSNNRLVLQFWYPLVGSSIRLWMLIIDTHAFTCILVQHWSIPPQLACTMQNKTLSHSHEELEHRLQATPKISNNNQRYQSCYLLFSAIINGHCWSCPLHTVSFLQTLDGSQNLLLDNLLFGFDLWVIKPWSGFIRVTMCLALSKRVINVF